MLSLSVSHSSCSYETTSSTTAMVLYFIAMNPEVQEKAYAEAQALADKNDGQLAGEDINELKYIDMVLSEATRLAPAPTIQRYNAVS